MEDLARPSHRSFNPPETPPPRSEVMHHDLSSFDPGRPASAVSSVGNSQRQGRGAYGCS